MKPQITYDDFDKVDIRVGTVISVKKNEKARKPSLVVEVDFGKEIGVGCIFLNHLHVFTDDMEKESLLNHKTLFNYRRWRISKYASKNATKPQYYEIDSFKKWWDHWRAFSSRLLLFLDQKEGIYLSLSCLYGVTSLHLEW